jgi:hypothetical protein
MGKSDVFIFNEYLKILDNLNCGSVAFLGFPGENNFSRKILSNQKDFYDFSLGNWEINSDWSLQRKYDLIVCTRCPYFSKNPFDFFKKCMEHLNTNGKLLLDWGLGDHWRFKNYKVGWTRQNEHEYAYRTDNLLYSCLWNQDFCLNEEVIKFWNHVKGKFDYSPEENLNDVIKKEIPYIVNYPFDKISFKFLWPELPQLYIITLTTKMS